MNKDDFGWLKQVLPAVATAFGGPLAGVAAGFIAEKLGISDKTVESVTAAIQGMKPEQLIQMKAIEADLQKFFAELGIKELTLENADRDSARSREVQTKDYTNTILAFAIVGAFISTVILSLSGYTKIESVLAGTLIGYLSAKCEQVLAYYFGSTKGSAEKTRMIANSTPTKKE